MSVHIVTDSTVRFSSSAFDKQGRAVQQDLPVTVVPLRVEIDGQMYFDGIDLDENMLRTKLQSASDSVQILPPTFETFQGIYNSLYEVATTEIVSIHLPRKLGHTLGNAQRAAGTLLGQCKIEVLDSATTSLGLGFLVEAAAQAAQEGQTLDQVVRLVRGMIPQIYIVFFANKLEDLRHAEGIGRAQAMLGTMLGIKPLFTLEAGEIIPIEKVKTREDAIEKLIEFVTEFDAVNRVAIVKNEEVSDIETTYITDQLCDTFPNLEIPVMAYGPVLASFIGPAALGVVVYEDASYAV